MQFLYTQKPDQALTAARQWSALYPNDFHALDVLYGLYSMRGQTDKAVEAVRKIIEVEPAEEKRIFQVGDLYYDAQRYEEALAAYQQYAKRFPDEAAGHARVGRVHRAQGRLEKALGAFRSAHVAEPDRYYVPLAIAGVLMRQGRFEKARKQFRAGLRRARLPKHRASAYNDLVGYYWRRGKTARATALLDSLWEEQTLHLSDREMKIERLEAVPWLAKAGKRDFVEALLDSANQSSATQDGNAKNTLDLRMYAAEAAATFGDTTAAERRLHRFLAQADIYATNYGVDLEGFKHYLRGRVALLAGRHQKAVSAFTRYENKRPGKEAALYWLGRAEHRAGHLDDAEGHFERALQLDPSDPNFHLAYARLMVSQDRMREARAHLRRASKAWANADPDYRPAREAREFRATLGDT